MAKAKYERTKPHVNVGRSGTSTTEDALTAAITKAALENQVVSRCGGYRVVYRHARKRERGITLAVAHVDTRRERHYAHMTVPGHADYIKNMITGAAQMDGAILWRRQ